jgi:hypothetical protein
MYALHAEYAEPVYLTSDPEGFSGPIHMPRHIIYRLQTGKGQWTCLLSSIYCTDKQAKAQICPQKGQILLFIPSLKSGLGRLFHDANVQFAQLLGHGWRRRTH